MCPLGYKHGHHQTTTKKPYLAGYQLGQARSLQFAVAMHVMLCLITYLSPEFVFPSAKKLIGPVGNAELSLFQDGQQHQTRTYHLGDCSPCMESEKKMEHLYTLLIPNHANIKAFLAMVQNIQQELADLGGTSFIQPTYLLVPQKLPMDTVPPPLLDSFKKTRQQSQKSARATFRVSSFQRPFSLVEVPKNTAKKWSENPA